MTQQLQSILFNKSYPKLSKLLQQLFKSIKNQSNNPDKQIQQLLFNIAENKFDIYQNANTQKYNQVVIKVNQNVQNFYNKYLAIPENLKNLLIFSTKWFLFEVMSQGQHKIQEKQLVKSLLKLNSAKSYFNNPLVMDKIQKSLYLSITFLQIQTRRILAVKKSQWGQQLSILFQFLCKISEKYPQTHKLCRKVCSILTHCAIHYFNSIISIDNITAAQQFLGIFNDYYIGKYKFLNSDAAVVLLYNCLKVLLGVDKIPSIIIEPIKILFKTYGMQYCKSYGQNLLQLFFVIKLLIFRKPESKRISKSYNNKQQRNENGKMMRVYSQADGDISSDQFQRNQNPASQQKFLQQRLSIFLNINLDVIVVQLNEISQNIIRHRVASLATLICFKLGIKRFAKHFIQLMHDSPFNNDIQTIKLCFQLFHAQQFNKLQHLFQVVLSAPSCKNLKQREVLLAMCSIFTGLYLQNRQQALLYAKLNHQQSKKAILKQQTLLSHVGFAYYNMANHQKYLTSRQVFLTQALNVFKQAYQINSNDYLLTYCMGKICLSLYHYQQAYKYSIECCKSGRGLWVPFTLLACVYMCQRRVTKASIIIDQLLKKYDDVALLHYARAYVQVNKILIEVQADQQLQSSKMLGQQYYQIYKQKIMKSKSITTVLKQCQAYHQLGTISLKTDYQENYLLTLSQFTTENQKKIIFNIISLLFQLDQLTLVQNILKNIPVVPTTIYYKALLHEHRKQIPQAIHQYKQVLNQNQYHIQSLTNLSLLELQRNHIQKASHYIDLSQKFTDNNKVSLAKGMLLSKLGKTKEAHQQFLKERDIAWCQSLPDQIFYY